MTASLPMPETPGRVVRFWREAGFDRWFKSDAGFDHAFRERFMGAHLAAASRALGGAFQPYAATHRDIVQRFGRFPHRNDELGRETTPAERAFLDDGGFSGGAQR